MNITTYIQQGKCTNGSLSLIFGGIILFFVGSIYALCFYFFSTPEIKELIDSIPTIQIENGIVTQPEQTIFEKKIPFSDFYIRIDTTQDTSSMVLQSGILLTQSECYISWNGQVQITKLPTEKITLDSSSIRQNIISELRQISLILAFILFIVLWLGFMLTFIITRVICVFFHKGGNIGVVKRATCVGWISIIVFNLILSCFGYGLNFLIAIPLATLIALFCLHNS